MIGVQDIVLLKAESMTNADDGGGRPSANVVQDGASNNMFQDITDLDRAYGDVSLAKVYPAVNTNDTDVLMDAYAIVASPPADNLVRVCLFTTGSWVDRRSDAANLLETYLARGTRWSGHLLEVQISGSRALQLAMRPTDPEPAVGQGMVLIQAEGNPAEYEQYVRVIKVESRLQNFTVKEKDVERKVVTLEISDPLRHTFTGLSVQDFEGGASAPAVIRDTRVADAARYYGAARLQSIAAFGQASLSVNSIFTNLVPSTQAETAMIDLPAVSPVVTMVEGKAGTITVTYAYTPDVSPLHLGSTVFPDTLSFTIGGNLYQDVAGVIKSAVSDIGTIDHESGVITWNSLAPRNTPSVAVTYKPAAAAAMTPYTSSFPVDQGNRGYNYIKTLQSQPAPLSARVSYVAQGKVYTLADIGGGKLAGADSSFGTGTINYVSRSLNVTLGALPDVGSEVVISWGTPITFQTRGDLPVKPAGFEFQLSQEGLAAGSLTVTWNLLGSPRMTTDANGVFSGDATGTVDYVTGKVMLYPNVLPPAGTEFSVAYSKGVPKTATTPAIAPSVTVGDVGRFIFTIEGTGSLLPNSIKMSLPVPYIFDFQTLSTTVTLFDRKLTPTTGELVDQSTGQVVGTINYETRQVNVRPVAKSRNKVVSTISDRSNYALRSTTVAASA